MRCALGPRDTQLERSFDHWAPLGFAVIVCSLSWDQGIRTGKMDKYSLSERDICTQFITPALRQAGWDVTSQIREEIAAIPALMRRAVATRKTRATTRAAVSPEASDFTP
jgi:hypothetical protein